MNLLGKSIVGNTEDIGNLTDAVNYISLASQQTITNTNDIRLNSIGDFAAGTKVVDFDPDHKKLISSKILISFPQNANDLGALRFYDKNGNGLYDGPVGQVAINDIRLTTGDCIKR